MYHEITRGVVLSELIYIIIFTILSFLFAAASLVAGYVCAYRNESDEKSQIYECGMKLFSDAKIQFDIKYFNYAILFLIFDVVTFLLFPFAVTFNKMPHFLLLEIVLFTLILLFTLFFIIKNNMLGDKS